MFLNRYIEASGSMSGTNLSYSIKATRAKKPMTIVAIKVCRFP
jgi:hypothetical protein